MLLLGIAAMDAVGMGAIACVAVTVITGRGATACEGAIGMGCSPWSVEFEPDWEEGPPGVGRGVEPLPFTIGDVTVVVLSDGVGGF